GRLAEMKKRRHPPPLRSICSRRVCLLLVHQRRLRCRQPHSRSSREHRQSQQGPPARIRKKLSISPSVPKTESPSTSLEPQAAQHWPAIHRKNASMSESVPT